MKKTFIAFVAFTLLLFFGAGQAAALSPPVPPKGEVVFSNGGRIVSIKADGSGRTVLTRKRAKTGSRDFLSWALDLGDVNPVISPDGKLIAFLRTAFRKDEYSSQLMVMNRDGTGQRELLRYGNSYLGSLDWSPDNKLLVTLDSFQGVDKKGHDLYRQKLLTLNAKGEQRQVLLSTAKRGFLGTPWLQAQAISPDGTSLLYSRSNLNESQLRIRDLATGKERLVTFGAQDASFSPDGSTIVFPAVECHPNEDRSCAKGKWLERGLWKVAITGGQRERISGDPYATSPSFSPDGGRIVFASSRNSPAHEEQSREIYSITSNGKCLTWLTNGSPASLTPDFGPEMDNDYSPGGCGSLERPPLVEIKPTPARKSDPRPRLWAGPQVGSRLLSSLATYWGGPNELYVYADCAYFDPSKCERPLALESTSVCYGIDEVEVGDRSRRIMRRGVPVFRSWDRGRLRIGGTLLATGRSGYAIGESLLFTGDRGIPNTFADHLKVIDLLRPVGQPLVPGSKLPARIEVNCRR